MKEFWFSVTIDFIAALACFALAVTMISIARARRFRFSTLLIWCAGFVVIRALGHIAEAAMMWFTTPILWLGLKSFVAASSISIAIWIYKLRSDISNLAEVEALNEEKIRAEDANAAKSQFLANMSHEFRTPLAAVCGFSDLLLGDTLTEAEREKALVTIRRNSLHLSHIVSEILDLSKIEAGQLEIEKLSFEVSEVLDYVSSIVNFQAVEKGVTLKVTVDPDVPRRIATDPTRLRQILVNIIGNAVKFTEKGFVEVRVSRVTASRAAEPPKLKFLVRDSGVGIPPEHQHRLFHPFSQSDCSTNRKFGGTGLGLALSRRLAHALGGGVELVKSTPGEGTEFSVTVKIGSDVLSAPTKQIVAGRRLLNVNDADFKGLKILAVDDSPDNRELLKVILRPSGALVSLAENGADAVERAMRDDFDIVLMDVQMPVLDGYAATRLLRSRGYQKPIIALTAHALKEDRKLAFAAGCDDHLTKPIERSSLFDVLAHYSRRYQTCESLRPRSPFC